MSHKLIEIPSSEWPSLRDMYSDMKQYASAYATLQNYINWHESDENMKTKIYSLNGNWKQDGTFLLIDRDAHVDCLSFNTLSDNVECLTDVFSCLDKNTPYLFAAFSERISHIVKKFFHSQGLEKNEFACDGTNWYHISKDEATKFAVEPPAGITLRSLELQHAETINKIWPHRAPGSVKFVERLIRYNINVGAFDQDGNLVAWCLRLPTGALGILQVLDSHKRQGLGNLLVRNMAKKIAMQNDEVMAPVVFTNTASNAMFQKLGFRQIDKVFWAFKLNYLNGNNLHK